MCNISEVEVTDKIIVFLAFFCCVPKYEMRLVSRHNFSGPLINKCQSPPGVVTNTKYH